MNWRSLQTFSSQVQKDTEPHARVYISKMLHRAIAGPHATIIRRLQEKTSCNIEVGVFVFLFTGFVEMQMPRFEDVGDEIDLRGTQSQINAAIDGLRAIVNALMIVPCPKPLHSRLIGTDGANIASLTVDTGCMVDFQAEFAIISGAEDKQAIIKERLAERMKKISASGMSNDKFVEKTITVPKAMHVYVMGQRVSDERRCEQTNLQGTTMADLQNRYNVRVFTPPPMSNSEEMIICGRVSSNVENAAEAIDTMVSAKMLVRCSLRAIFTKLFHPPRLDLLTKRSSTTTCLDNSTH